MKIGVLTSSRADYGIYTPLLQKLSSDPRFDLEIIAFGMHLLENQGLTITEVEKDAFGVVRRIAGMPERDRKQDIAYGYGDVVKHFAGFWSHNHYDCVLVLGDRWEMSAAVQAALPFEMNIAHLHGGETTLGAIDNIYRHQITLASTYHFTAAEPFSQRVKDITGSSQNIYTVGSISLEQLEELRLPDWEQVKAKFSIPFDTFILVTIHPESVGADKNEKLAEAAYRALEKLTKYYNILITKANSDVMGSLYNAQFARLEAQCPRQVKLVSSLGKLNYFKAMAECAFMLGNTSSGIVEAASFGKWVINIGDRQEGRLRNDNVLDVPFDEDQIIKSAQQVKGLEPFSGENKYVRPNTTDKIIEVLAEHEGL